MFLLHRLDRNAALLSEHAVDLADIEAGAHQELLQFLDLGELQLRHRMRRLAHRRGARDAGGEIARGSRIDQRVIPFGIGREIRVGEERRPRAAHRQEHRCGQIVIGQWLAIRIGHAPGRPFRPRMFRRKVRLLPRQIRWHADFLQPRLAAPPFQSGGDVVRGRADHVGRAVQHVAMAVAIIVHGIVEVMRRQELRLSELAGPGADHL